MIGQVHNAQLDATQPQISENVINTLHQQLQDVKMTSVRGKLGAQTSFINHSQSIS